MLGKRACVRNITRGFERGRGKAPKRKKKKKKVGCGFRSTPSEWRGPRVGSHWHGGISVCLFVSRDERFFCFLLLRG